MFILFLSVENIAEALGNHYFKHKQNQSCLELSKQNTGYLGVVILCI